MRAPGVILALVCFAASGCTVTNPDPMRAQDKEKAYAEEDWFADGRAMRVPVEDTVPKERGYSRDALPGGGWDAGFAERNPLPLDRQVLADGEQSFTIYCATCHGLMGDGNSEVAQKMALRPPPALYGPLHGVDKNPPSRPGDVLPHPRGFYFSVMSHGYGLMPQYGSALTPRQRWAVVAYLETLARSQAVPVASLPADVQRRLREEQP